MSDSVGPGRREEVYCHECGEDWYRDEHGLVPCPNCGSEFTEAIEPDNDPREGYGRRSGDLSDEDAMSVDRDDPDMPPLLAHRLGGESGNDRPNQFNIRPTGPGRYAVTGTFHSSFPPLMPGQRGHSPRPRREDGIGDSFMNMLLGMMGTHGENTGSRNPDIHTTTTTTSSRPDTTTRTIRLPGVGVTMTRMTTNFRTHDPNSPHSGPQQGQPMQPTPADLDRVLTSLLTTLGNPNHAPNHHVHMPSPANPSSPQPGGPGPPPNPIAQLFGLLFADHLNPDVAYSQEQFDRIMSQLMEQTNASNAPGPASATAIANLPRKQIVKEMLDDNGHAECSICMDEVVLGQEVTMLYCNHWFHHDCVAAWLSEHDTCPHCRKGIERPADTTGPNHSASTAQPGSSGVPRGWERRPGEATWTSTMRVSPGERGFPVNFQRPEQRQTRESRHSSSRRHGSANRHGSRESSRDSQRRARHSHTRHYSPGDSRNRHGSRDRLHRQSSWDRAGRHASGDYRRREHSAGPAGRSPRDVSGWSRRSSGTGSRRSSTSSGRSNEHRSVHRGRAGGASSSEGFMDRARNLFSGLRDHGHHHGRKE